VYEINSFKSGRVKCLNDGSLTHVHSVLHRELEVVVRSSGVLWVEKLLDTDSLIVI